MPSRIPSHTVIPIDKSLEIKIIKQLEYYFSDINLRSDHFINNLAKKDSGWLSIETLMTFNRIKSLVDNDKSLLSEALKTLQSNVIECHPNGHKIRRRTDRPVPQMDSDVKRYFDELTVEVNGFPLDTTMDELLQWSEKFGSVLNVKMVRLKGSHQFTGIAVIMFSEKRMADSLVNQSALKFKDSELTKETKFVIKERNRKQKTALNSEDLILKMKTVSMDTTTEQNAKMAAMEGTVLQLKGIPRRLVTKEKKKKSNRIKEFFAGYGKVIYVSSDSSGNCLVQFNDRSVGQKILDSNKKLGDKEVVHKLVFSGKEVTARLLSSDEEIDFWIRANRCKEKKLKRNERRKSQRKSKIKTKLKRSNSSLISGQDPKRLTTA